VRGTFCALVLFVELGPAQEPTLQSTSTTMGYAGVPSGVMGFFMARLMVCLSGLFPFHSLSLHLRTVLAGYVPAKLPPSKPTGRACWHLLARCGTACSQYTALCMHAGPSAASAINRTFKMLCTALAHAAVLDTHVAVGLARPSGCSWHSMLRSGSSCLHTQQTA
jgi:hypothetical protein